MNAIAAGTVLILGGTAEARALAAALVAADRPVITSLAGRVRDPALPAGEVRIGGFSGTGVDGIAGLAGFLAERRVERVVDATHPFAATISAHAAAAVAVVGVPLLRLERPGWDRHPDAGRWTWVETAEQAVAVGRDFRRPFLTTGRHSLRSFMPWSDRDLTARVVDSPDFALPRRWRLIRSRGPYAYAHEQALMSAAGTDVLVTKDSGGEHTVAKLAVARDIDVTVIVIARPPRLVGIPVATTVDEVLVWLW